MNLVTVENTSKEAIQGNEFVHIIAIFSLILQYAPSNVPNIGRGFRSHRSMSHNFLLYQVKANTNNDSFPWTVLQKKKRVILRITLSSHLHLTGLVWLYLFTFVEKRKKKILKAEGYYLWNKSEINV